MHKGPVFVNFTSYLASYPWFLEGGLAEAVAAAVEGDIGERSQRAPVAWRREGGRVLQG